jgi:hypothetical protein
MYNRFNDETLLIGSIEEPMLLDLIRDVDEHTTSRDQSKWQPVTEKAKLYSLRMVSSAGDHNTDGNSTQAASLAMLSLRTCRLEVIRDRSSVRTAGHMGNRLVRRHG